MRTLSAAFAALVVLMALGACGGGSMSSTGMNATQKVATSGTITAFGSVFVNGVRYDVSAASLRKNGRSVTQGRATTVTARRSCAFTCRT